jgi:two-component system, NarL family, response regulator YdfI
VRNVFVSADSPAELARLEALVRAAPALKLAGSSLGGAGLDAQAALSQADVLLEQVTLDSTDGSGAFDGELNGVVRVILVAEPDFSEAFAVMQPADAAVRGVLPTWASVREIQAAVEAAAAGLIVFHPDVAEQAGRAAETGSAPHTTNLSRGQQLGQQLSPREAEVLDLLAAGLGNKEIAKRLEISNHTVKFHVTSIFNKLGASSRAEAVAIGMRRGVIIL